MFHLAIFALATDILRVSLAFRDSLIMISCESRMHFNACVCCWTSVRLSHCIRPEQTITIDDLNHYLLLDREHVTTLPDDS